MEEKIRSALSAIEACENALSNLGDDGLKDQAVQLSLLRIHRFRITKSKTTDKRRRNNDSRTQTRPSEAFCTGMTEAAAKNFMNASNAVMNDAWEKPQGPIFSKLEFERKAAPILTLLNSYRQFANTRKAVLRVLSVLIAHDIDQSVETLEVSGYGDTVREWAQRLQMDPLRIVCVERTGRWYMDFLSLDERIGLGALLMMGRAHTWYVNS